MSDREFMIPGKLVLTFACLPGWPIWELWKLKRDLPAQQAGEQDRKRITSAGRQGVRYNGTALDDSARDNCPEEFVY
jgi:hypothetical protein